MDAAREWQAEAEIGLFLESPLPPLSAHLSWLTTVYERGLLGSGLKNNALVSKQLNSWGRGVRARVRNRRQGGARAQGAVEVAELAGGEPSAIR